MESGSSIRISHTKTFCFCGGLEWKKVRPNSFYGQVESLPAKDSEAPAVVSLVA